MKILRIKLRNYRGVAEREVHLEPSGVTVIQGPNEIGKSSLAEAVDLVFKHLDSSARAEVKAVKPVHADEGAEVEVDAECGPYAFTLFKRFHKKAATRLEVRRPRPESLTGREAHERVRAILEETIDLPLWDALRIQQGSGVKQADLKDQSSLAAALDKAAGGATTGEREESLFEAVRTEYERYYTETGKPKREVEQAEKDVTTAQEELESIQRAVECIEADVARSAKLENETARMKGEEARLKALAAEREADWRAVERRVGELKGLESQRNEAQTVEKTAAAAVDARAGLVAAVESARKAHASLVAEIEAQAPARQVSRAERDSASGERDEARQAHEAAARLLDIRRMDHEFRRDELDMEQLRERKTRIDAAIQNGEAAEKLLLKTRMNDEVLKRIEDAHIALETAQTRLDAARTTVSIEALADIAPEVNGTSTPLAREERKSFPVEGSLEIQLPGMARIAVRSGSSVVDLEEELEKAKRRLAAACEKGAVADLKAARDANDARRDAQRVKARKDEVLKENLRDLTREVLERKLADLKARVEDYGARRPAEPALASDLDAAKEILASAQSAEKAALDRRERAERAFELTRENRAKQEKAEVEGATKLKLAADGIERAQKALNDARAAKVDEQLSLERADAAARAWALEAAYGEASKRLAAEDPERVKDIAENARAAHETAADQLRQAEDELLEVATTLKTHGEDGLEERRGAAQARLERLKLERDGLLARATGAKLLFETLRQMRNEARRKYVAPLREQIEKLGRYVFVFKESFGVELSDDLQVQSRTLDGRTVPFRDLSVGTQEQISVIARLACAMTVSPNGGVPVVLDDALGYSDPERLQQMGAVLARAGREMQVIVLTCMPDRYCQVGGAHVVRLG